MNNSNGNGNSDSSKDDSPPLLRAPDSSRRRGQDTVMNALALHYDNLRYGQRHESASSLRSLLVQDHESWIPAPSSGTPDGTNSSASVTANPNRVLRTQSSSRSFWSLGGTTVPQDGCQTISRAILVDMLEEAVEITSEHDFGDVNAGGQEDSTEGENQEPAL